MSENSWRHGTQPPQGPFGFDPLSSASTSWADSMSATTYNSYEKIPRSIDYLPPVLGRRTTSYGPPQTYPGGLCSPLSHLPHYAFGDPTRRYGDNLPYLEPHLSTAHVAQETSSQHEKFSGDYSTVEMQRTMSSPSHETCSHIPSLGRGGGDVSNSGELPSNDPFHVHRKTYPTNLAYNPGNRRERNYSLSGLQTNFASFHRHTHSTSTANSGLFESTNQDVCTPYDTNNDHTNESHHSPQESYILSPMTSQHEEIPFRVNGSYATRPSPRISRSHRASHSGVLSITPDSNFRDTVGRSMYEAESEILEEKDDSTQPSSKAQRRMKEWRCPEPDCTVKPFLRKADMQRHQDQVHHRSELELHDCFIPQCSRKGPGQRGGFGRKDHLLEHLRNYHNLPIPKRQLGGGRRTIHNLLDEVHSQYIGQGL